MLFLNLQLWVYRAIFVLRVTHGTIVKRKVKSAWLTWIDAPRCTINWAMPRCSRNIAFPVLDVPRTTILPAKVKLVRLNVTSAVVMATTATLVRLLESVVSCC